MRVAIFIDGDNVSPAHADRIAALGQEAGDIGLCRVYTDASRPGGWHASHATRLIHAGTGKNAADLLLAIDAMDHCQPGAYDLTLIASSDGDFFHLATRLRERGLRVIGVGEPKAPKAFREACSRFVILNAETKSTSARISALDRNIYSVIVEHSRKGAGMRLVDLAPKIHSRFGIRISTLPERTWRAYLGARPTLYALDPRGPDAHVRYRPEGFAA